jgi:hypothetical protein
LLINGIADLNIETRRLAHLTMNPHPNVSMLRAMSGGDRFSPDFFIVIDRLYDTLETRLDKWMEKAQKLSSPVGGKRLRSLLLGLSKRGHAPKDNLHGERSMLLDDQLRAVYELSSAIAHMHEHKIMHRDLKPTNLAFDIRDDIKVRDLSSRETTLFNSPLIQRCYPGATSLLLTHIRFSTWLWERRSP